MTEYLVVTNDKDGNLLEEKRFMLISNMLTYTAQKIKYGVYAFRIYITNASGMFELIWAYENKQGGRIKCQK